MKIRYVGLLLLLIALGSFLAGYWINSNSGNKRPEHKILHYVDPMNPAFKSDKPGIAPCGMPLEPVYADQGATVASGAALTASMPPGAFRISAERQQLIGVKVIAVEKAPWTHTLRVLGRVTPDETRVSRVNATLNGRIVEVSPVTTGSIVQKDALLATFSFFSPEFLKSLQTYLSIVGSGPTPDQEETALQRVRKQNEAREYANLRAYSATGVNPALLTDVYRQNILSYGITKSQLERIERTRTLPTLIEVRAPISGFILARNVSPDLSFDRGAEFYRIADLSRVWILADVFENEASFFKPGMRVKIELPYQKKTMYARMSDVLPQFDPSTRTLKIRLEAENPGYGMRPDMLVNVELPVSGPPAIIVPVDAVLDSGLNKTVFVDRGGGFFEPRQVETGRSLGERVEIVRGLMPGEKIVVSGNFLIDSEARMQKASVGITGKIARDPVCGMNVDEDHARSTGNYVEYKGQTYFFCDAKERDAFRREPERYLKRTTALKSGDAGAQQHSSHETMALPKSRDMKKMHHSSEAMPASGQNKKEHVSGAHGAASVPLISPAERQATGAAVADPSMGTKAGGAFHPMASPTDSKSVPGIFMPMPAATPTPGQAPQPSPGAPGMVTATEPTSQPALPQASPRGGRKGLMTPGFQGVPAVVPQPVPDTIVNPGTVTVPADQQPRGISGGGNAHD